MRTSLIVPLILSSLLAACATTQEGSPSKHISQAGSLKVHPGLVGKPVPDELRDPQQVAAVKVVDAPAATQTMQMDAIGQRTQRSVYFDYKSADLKMDYDSVLQGHAKYLAANPKSKIRVEGNADERGSVGYNNVLGQKRAETVRQRLIDQGAASQQVSIKSLGELKPKLKGHDEESWAENRRADIIYEREE